MNQISLLSQETIDKIAAGEVVERPASIVKELVENAIDAGANAVTVEIKEGGISLIRITDNGEGIPADQVRVAFLRHATSKIRTVDDLLTSGTLGFRGEALSSIAAVCQVELITKTAGSITGTRYVIEGGSEKVMEEIGAPLGTTFLVRNLFYHTPARKKFLKSASTEAGYISDLMERMALSNPDVSFKFINQNDVKLHTSGNCNLKDIVYGIYGREIASNVVKLTGKPEQSIQISGFIGKPLISRGNRNYENYFVNGRYVKSTVIARAIEDAYKPFMMNHRYPFTALMIRIDTDQVDVNVHPAKMEVRFANQMEVYDAVYQAVKDALAGRELIPEITIEERRPVNDLPAAAQPEAEKKVGRSAPEPFEKIRSQLLAEAKSPYETKYPVRKGSLKSITGNLPSPLRKDSETAVSSQLSEYTDQTAGSAQSLEHTDQTVGSAKPLEHTDQTSVSAQSVKQTDPAAVPPEISGKEKLPIPSGLPQEVREKIQEEIQQAKEEKEKQPVQMELFQDRLLGERSRKRHRIIGQLFETYWLVEFDEKLYIIDQHAAHEKVMYERFMKNLREKQLTSQMITPPVILTLSMQEENVLKQNLDHFTAAGFEISHFGGRDYAISAVPGNLYQIADRELFLEILDGLTDVSEKASSDLICERIASMSCKAAVKGNHRLSYREAEALIDELLGLENPYNCPHGRPTIVSMSRYELEKKFKRVL